MEVNIQSIHFDATEKLVEYINKKTAKLEKRAADATSADFSLKLVKPETNNNKIVSLSFSMPGRTIHVEKTCNTFEEAVDQCVDVALREVEKMK
ncbi:MAG: ribosome-associated translation inhibitor RaiA [Bacteroidaceae bacterium]|nr:ribosome-associated translation inhibitor RaiA [Bacteroidaceae bacterium]